MGGSIHGRRILALLMVAVTATAAACLDYGFDPQPVVDVTGEYDAVAINGRALPASYDSTATAWSAIIAMHLAMRSARSWSMLRTDRRTANNVSRDTTYESLRGSWDNSAGGPAVVSVDGSSGRLQAVLRRDTLLLTEGCLTVAECASTGGGSVTFVRSR